MFIVLLFMGQNCDRLTSAIGHRFSIEYQLQFTSPHDITDTVLYCILSTGYNSFVCGNTT